MPANRWARAGARSRWRSPSALQTARSQMRTSLLCASGSWRRCGRSGVSCVHSDAAGQMFAAGAPRVIVAGATGFAGALAAHLLWRHPRFELVSVTGRSEAGRRLQDVYPRYRVPLEIETLDEEALPEVDAAIVAYPHAAAAPTVGVLRAR